MEAALSEPVFTRKLIMLSSAGGFMLYGKLVINFFSTSELQYPNFKIRLRPIRTKPICCMTSDNSNVSPGIVDC